MSTPIFIDASAIVAILTDEDDARLLAKRLTPAKIRLTSPAAIWEASVNVARICDLSVMNAYDEIIGLLSDLTVEIKPIPPEATVLALKAFEQFGKGRHPAALNFGDCMAYACARHYEAALLFKGNDFSQTDITSA